jgi:predicted ATPase
MSRDPYQPVWDALNATGYEWHVEPGKKHRKIKMAGFLVGILPHGKHNETDMRAIKNTVAQIARAAQQIKETGRAFRP